MNHRGLTVTLCIMALVALGVAARVMDHAPNFTPLIAISLMTGCLMRSRMLAAVVPLAIMAVSDLFFLGGYEWRVMAAVYAALAFPALLRPVTRTRLSAIRVGGSALGAGAVFFAVTNFAHWLFMGMYDMNLGGLMQAYAAALPFYKYQVAGDLFWSACLFGTYAIARRLAYRLPHPAAGPQRLPLAG